MSDVFFELPVPAFCRRRSGFLFTAATLLDGGGRVGWHYRVVAGVAPALRKARRRQFGKKEFAASSLNPKTDAENEVENQSLNTDCQERRVEGVPPFAATARSACFGAGLVCGRGAAAPNSKRGANFLPSQ